MKTITLKIMMAIAAMVMLSSCSGGGSNNNNANPYAYGYNGAFGGAYGSCGAATGIAYQCPAGTGWSNELQRCLALAPCVGANTQPGAIPSCQYGLYPETGRCWPVSRAF